MALSQVHNRSENSDYQQYIDECDSTTHTLIKHLCIFTGKYPLPPGPFGSLLSEVVSKCKQIYLQFRPGLDLGKLPKGIMASQGLPVEVLSPPQAAYDWQRFNDTLRYIGCLFVCVVGWNPPLRNLILIIFTHRTVLAVISEDQLRLS